MTLSRHDKKIETNTKTMMNTNKNTSSSDLRRRRLNNDNVTNRQDLFIKQNQQPLSSTKKNKKKQANNNDEHEQSKAIQSSLIRTKQMMQSELQRVSEVTTTIQDDGKKIKSTKDQHLSMEDGVKGARYTLLWLKVKEKEDSVIFWSAVTFFYLVVLYVMWTRVRIPFLLW